VSDLVGRDALLAAVVERLGTHRLVTLTGVGGVGKTSVAVEVARQVGPRFRHGTTMVDLSAIVDPTDAPTVMATTLGVIPQAETPIVRTLIDAVAGQHLLLVLDNCEHVLTAVAEIVEGLLKESVELRILTTSRECLQVAGEVEIAVSPLAADSVSSPAVALFTQRARAVRPNFELDDHPATTAAVIEICRRLDGLPLGIELAAARMAGMGVVDVRDRLDDRFRLLEGGRGAPSRQQSLGELVRWSYELLTEDEQDVMRRSAVFVGGFNLAGFVGVVGGRDEVTALRALDRLVRSSLMVTDHADGRVRYRLLETMRQFGLDELAAAGLIEELRNRHARWFASEVVGRWETHNGPGWRAATDWLRGELGELRAAFTWAAERDLDAAVDIAAHAAILGVTANVFEPITWAERILDVATAAHHPRLPRLLCGCGYACFVGRPAAAAEHAERAMLLETQPEYEGCEPGMSAFVAALANVYAGRLDRYVELAATADGFGGPALAFARPALVDGLQASDRVDEALELLDSSIESARRLGSPFWLAYALWIGGTTLSKVDPVRALTTWDEGLVVVRDQGVDFFRGFMARDAARLHTRTGASVAALDQFDVAIDAFVRAGNVAQLTITLASLPELFARLGEMATAATLHAALVQVPASVEHVPELADLGTQLSASLGKAAATAIAVGRQMDLDEAAVYARACIEELQHRRSPDGDRPGGLSRREVEVLRLVADGLTTREIAERLFISAKTADRHIQNIYVKIAASSRAMATRWAIEHGVTTDAGRA
jgi:predicted ATPase/DNA-binding CsgD family transcriptional regulator